MSFDIIQVPADERGALAHVARYKAFRLLALQTAPESFGATYSDEVALPDDFWLKRLANLDATTFLAVRDDTILSTLTITGPLPFAPEEFSPQTHAWEDQNQSDKIEAMVQSHYRINGMFTLPRARGQGIGKALIEEAKKRAAEKANTRGKDWVISLVAEKANLDATQLYARCEFVTLRETGTPVAGRAGNVLLMQYPAPRPKNSN